MLKQNKNEMIIALIMVVTTSIGLCIAEYITCINTAIEYNIEIWIGACKILDFFFPLIVSMPFNWIIYYEIKDDFIKYASVRIKKKKYYFNKIKNNMIIVFIMIFTIYFIGLMFAIFILKSQNIIMDENIYKFLFGKMQAQSPLLFGIMWCLWKAFIGAIILCTSQIASIFIRNIFIISLISFLYCTIENFITGTLHLEKYSICTTYILNRLSPKRVSYFSQISGLITFLFFWCLTIFVLYRKNRCKNEKYN